MEVTEPAVATARRRLHVVDPHIASHPLTLIAESIVNQGDAVSGSTTKRRVADGTQVPPIKVGVRCLRYVAGEILAVRRARIAEATPEELRQLVRSLVEARRRAS